MTSKASPPASPYKSNMYVHLSVILNVLTNLKGYFLRQQVDEIWREDMHKVNAHILRILLKIISMEKIIT